LFTAFLDTKLRMDPTREEHVKDATIKGTMGFAMRLRIAVPDYEVNGQLWRINHYEGSALYDQDLVFLAFEDGPGNWGVAWGVNRPDSGSDDLEVVRAPAADATAEDGETAFRRVQDGALQFWLPDPSNHVADAFRAWLRLTARHVVFGLMILPLAQLNLVDRVPRCCGLRYSVAVRGVGGADLLRAEPSLPHDRRSVRHADCQTGPIERHTIKADPPIEYLLGVVEFDDRIEIRPAQMDTLFAQLQVESATEDLCLVVFVHGWENNASYNNGNVQEFRQLLEQLARTEGQHLPGAWSRPRKVVGIYAGWRGRSLDAGALSAITFWNRKDAAQRVASGSIRELLGRARALRDTIDRTTWEGKLLPIGALPPPGQKLRSTRLLTIGHSFGGLIVYTALAQYFTDRAAASGMATSLGATADADKAIAGYGDLVVLINPAVEAITWEPIRQLVEKRPASGYARRQRPVFVEVTSTADDATGIAFPLGRSLNTIAESFTGAEEKREATVALGSMNRSSLMI
jgi:hypothetical protein